MAPWQAFIMGALLAIVVLSILYGSLVIEAEEKAYRKGLHDGKNRKPDGNVSELREDT